MEPVVINPPQKYSLNNFHMLLTALLPSKTNSTTNISATIIYNIIIHSVCRSVCHTEVCTLYGRLSRRWQPRMGCAWRPWLHATHWAQRALRFQWGLSQQACEATGAFSTAGARRLQAFIHHRSSHSTIVACYRYYFTPAIQTQLLWYFESYKLLLLLLPLATAFQ